ncbi:MinD/ParA family protein [Corynebacterium amycolatum]|uniref:MinD/ParA family ATP-binding protein n=1 Tax=Corynebacterium amycolatum TaxID=43765 RepID=UPI00254DD407|nr:MinD/ParA family protein [Corynebacterium amycolatum]MDK7145175.1 MinD/ParA family protein [Corynebacterium amycolatum]
MSSDDLFGERRIEYRGRSDDQAHDAYSFGAVDSNEESPFDFDSDTAVPEVRVDSVRDREVSQPPREEPPQARRSPRRRFETRRRSHLQAVPAPADFEATSEDEAGAVTPEEDNEADIDIDAMDDDADFDAAFDQEFDSAFDKFDDFPAEQSAEVAEAPTTAQPTRRIAAEASVSAIASRPAFEFEEETAAVAAEPADKLDDRIAGVTTGKRVANHNYASPDLPTPERKSFIERLTGLFPAKKAKGPTTDELRFIRRNLTGSFNISVVNVKGGVGKTVTADLLGKTFSSQRNDRVIAVDATPEGGELIDRCRNENNGTIRSLIEQLPLVSRYSHIREHTSQSDSGLEVLGSDPSVIGAQRLTGDEYREVMKALRTFYQVIITDCAQGVTGELMEAVLDETDLLLLVSEGADGMRAATKTANDLASADGYWNGRYAHLVEDMVVVVNSRSPRSNVDVGKVEEFFSSIARAVVTLPFDQALEGGRGVELSEVSEATRAAGIDLASKVAASSSFKDGGR